MPTNANTSPDMVLFRNGRAEAVGKTIFARIPKPTNPNADQETGPTAIKLNRRCLAIGRPCWRSLKVKTARYDKARKNPNPIRT